MKSSTTALRDHLDQEVTALCTCWSITRVDGTTLRFTDADEDVIQGGQVYTSIGAYQRTAIENTSTLSVDNLEIIGASNDLALPEEELRAGLFDNAEITIFLTPWLDSVRGRLKLRRGFFGEVQTLPNGTYQVELRGIMQRLSYNYMDIFSSSCLYDLGEPACGTIIKGADMDNGTQYAVGEGARIAQTAYQRGKAYDINWGDVDFETAGAAGGVGESVYWFNKGVVPATIDGNAAYTGTYAAVGGSGASALSQDVDLEDTTGLPQADIDGETCYLTTRTFRRDSGSTAQLSIEFLDRDGVELGYGQQLTLGASGFNADPITFAGDFTLEMWVKLESTANDDQVIFGGGRFGTTGGNMGTRLAFDGGRLTLWGDDDVYNGSGGGPVVQSSEETPLDEWRHIALVRNGADFYLYENFRQTAVNNTYTGSVWIDTWGTAVGSAGFVGKWDELRVWSAAKTLEELGLDAFHAISPVSTNLFRYYSFNDTNGADLTGGDLTFSFGPGPNLQTGHGSPVSVPVIYASALGTATYSSGFASVGTTWTETGVQDHKIPANTRRMRINLEATGGDARFDNLTGHIINTNEYGRVIGYMTNDIAWRCTTAGFTNADQASGAEGTTINVGGVEFFGEDAYLRGARVLSVSDNRTFIIEVNEPRAVDAWFNEGAVIFETGGNAGAAMEIKSWDATTRQIELFLSMPNVIKAGDYLSLYPGCDKSRISCAAIFGNITNFYGTPDVPGQDELFRYPDSK